MSSKYTFSYFSSLKLQSFLLVIILFDQLLLPTRQLQSLTRFQGKSALSNLGNSDTCFKRGITFIVVHASTFFFACIKC